ncbi:MAG: hypothetical protein L6R38_004365 [Xanthoria sp. 2 TBL-2021]|nr:MAG: hypothetical protein L6R38_004365 [Xanthoria sp. 2 TBL-2021]
MLLIHILKSIPTLSLLQLRLVSHHFQNIILRLVHQRLLVAASLEDRKLILECYHPSAQYTEPYLFCDYLGTPGLSNDTEGQGELYQHFTGEKGQLKQLYSHFRPTRADVGTRVSRPHPAGDVPGSRTNPVVQASSSTAEEQQLDLVTHNISLDVHELFTQLSITAALVQVGPRRGVFLSFIDVVDKRTPRVWRGWLDERARKSRSSVSEEQMEKVDDQSSSMIWADQGKTMGLKVQVKEKMWREQASVLVHRDEDPAISYSLELEELLISTTHLLLAVEKSLLESRSDGKAMIFGSFATAATSDGAAA